MNTLASALTAALIDFAWQGIVVACLLWITLFTLRNRSANVRYLASCSALLTMIVIPIFTAYLSYHPIMAGPPVPSMPFSPQAVPMAALTEPNSLWLQTWVLPAWSLGVLSFSCRLIWGCWRLSALKRRGRAVSEDIRSTVDNLAARLGLTRTVRILLSTLAETPSVAGFFRPIILLPISSLAGLTPQQLEAILAHELAHIRRYDPLVNAAQILIETLLFYHPAVWWTSARIRHERELCCDDLAVRCCDDALCYARALTALEKFRSVPPAMAIGSTGGSLFYRIRRIMGERPRDYSPSKLSGILAMTLAVACLAVNVGTRMQAQDRPAPGSTLYESPGVRVDTAGAEVVEPIRYPRQAAVKAIQGTVVVQLDVDTQGNVTDARVLSGPPELRKAALQSLLTWRFKADGSASTRQISVNFQVPPLQQLDLRENNRAATVGGLAEADAKHRAEEDTARSAERSNEEGRARQAMMLAKEQMEKLKRSMASDSEDLANQQRLAKLAAEIAAMQKRIEFEAAGWIDQRKSGAAMAGRILARIDVAGLSDEQRDQLIRQLPVKLGDTLSQEILQRIVPIIRSVDQRLKFELVPLDDKQVILKIAAAYFTLLGGQTDGEIAAINQEIAAREAQLEQFRGQLSDKHPDVLAFKDKLNDLKRRRQESLEQDPVATKEALSKLNAGIAGLYVEFATLARSTNAPDPEAAAKIQKQIHEMEALRDLQIAQLKMQAFERAGQQSAETPGAAAK